MAPFLQLGNLSLETTEWSQPLSAHFLLQGQLVKGQAVRHVDPTCHSFFDGLHRFTGYVPSILQDSTCHKHRSRFTFIYGWICSHTPTVLSSSRWSQDISKNHISNWCDRSSRGRKLAAIPSPPMRPWATRKVSWKPLRTDGWPMVGGWKSSVVPSGYVKIAIEKGHL